MYHITFISTTHKENGNCNANELCKIINTIVPDLIFLEALQDTYSKYDEYLFAQYAVFHKKLEIEAIQKYRYKAQFTYVPVLDLGMPDAFEKKYEFVTQNRELQKKIENFNELASKGGFKFLNSDLSVKLQEEMRELENIILGDCKLHKNALEAIEAYENIMLENIHSYCKTNHFDRAIFLCGVAHRKSIVKKIEKIGRRYEINLNWQILKF